ncbi:hypothetical protein OTK49_01805 [Vibrio coralliirubri]|uniref:hypothetical protein n=1 Tax=Vibrio coralliirubri TaxID=1516159 RepID=UPI0022844C02|nr:hypothetical protein [Vibrio coralliirubri]MCY9861248.1 hypothetical protein [Vibrio coralliirubri]
MSNTFKFDVARLITAINERKSLDELWDICAELKQEFAPSTTLMDAVALACDGLLSVEPDYQQTIDMLILHLEGRCLSRCSLSDTDDDVIRYIAALVESFNYRKLPKALSEESRKLYAATIPEWCHPDGNNEIKLATSDGTIIANGYSRLVVGDYGAFIEYSREQAIKDVVKCKEGEEYRFRDPEFKGKVKYYWYTAKDESGVKIYFQQKKVTYADYKPDMFYVSPFELTPIN